MIDDDLLREVGAALHVEPREDFERRVLARAEATGSRAVPWLRLVAAGACAAAAFVLFRAEQERSEAPALAVPPSASRAIVHQAGDAAAVAAARVGSEGTQASATVGLRRVPTRRSAARRGTSPVVIDPQQAQLFEVVLAQVAVGRVTMTPPSGVWFESAEVSEPPPMPLIEIPSIHIEPLPEGAGA